MFKDSYVRMFLLQNIDMFYILVIVILVICKGKYNFPIL